MDLSSLASEHGVGVLSGVLGTMLAKEMVGRFLRRSEQLENKAAEASRDAETKRDELISLVLTEVKGLHVTIAQALVRLDSHLVTINETKEKVESHGIRISSLEAGHAEMKTRIEYIGDIKDD